jgi:hypothetical protein
MAKAFARLAMLLGALMGLKAQELGMAAKVPRPLASEGLRGMFLIWEHLVWVF